MSPPSLRLQGSSPYTYRAFGLTVQSDMALPGFVEAPLDTPPDITVERDTVTAEQVVTFNDSGNRVGTAPPGILRALAEHGRRLTLDVDPDADPDFVAAVVTGELFSLLMRQRGRLVLHGSGIARDRRAVGFIGHSGWGKSTLAAALISRGWHMLTDDLLVIEGVDPSDADPTPRVLPSHPAMRLAPEAFQHVESRAPDAMTSGSAAHAFTTKLQTDWGAAFHDGPVPLAHLFILDPAPADAPESERPPPHVGVLELAQHTRVRRLLSAPAYRQAHLAQCSALVRAVPVAYLRRRFGLEYLDALCDYVEATVGQAGPRE